ncbi:unnamed protein product [Bursaphelenchus okinawaensis]|uniref:Uncharacterized protein n=1 Tax=Bursaphelenchus okinawaensis TaxID=465554 RepID=A0A811JT48_9BILA|nr:unnamed protein product [Bursaphelenchus okinawaensis]CAG9081292.1 unnamed protein product [Bursaphelenchus okinawaensis]
MIMSEVEVDTDDCATAVSGTFDLSELVVTFEDLSSMCSEYLLDSTVASSLSSISSSIPCSTCSGKLEKRKDSESSESSFSSSEHSSVEEVKDNTNNDESATDSSWESTKPLSFSEIITAFDDDCSFEYSGDNFIESSNETSGVETAVEFNEEDELWFMETANEKTENTDNNPSTCIDISDIRL